MSMSDCEMCWNTPCTCGWDWRNRNIQDLKGTIRILNRIISYKEKNPKAKFSSFGEERTEDDINIMKFIRENKE